MPAQGRPAAAATCSMWAADFADTGLHPPCTPTPILTTDQGVVGATIKYGDGRESMAFAFDAAAWSTSAVAIAHLAVSWALRDLIPGERRPLLTVHADDMFLSTAAGGAEARVRADDLRRHIRWQKRDLAGGGAVANAPAGTNIRFELPFNGNGILEVVADNSERSAVRPLDVDSNSCADSELYRQLGCNCFTGGWKTCSHPAEFCRACTKDHPKPPGTGVSLMPANTKAFVESWQRTDLRADERARMVLRDTDGMTRNFFFSHHTFTHENLDNATRHDSSQQILLNVKMAVSGGWVCLCLFLFFFGGGTGGRNQRQPRPTHLAANAPNHPRLFPPRSNSSSLSDAPTAGAAP
jgi:hypothetical protein